MPSRSAGCTDCLLSLCEVVLMAALKLWLFTFELCMPRGAKTHKRCWKRKREDEEMFLAGFLALWSLFSSCLWSRSCCSVSSCHCSGQKSALTPIVLHTNLQLQPVLPAISALCHACKIRRHLPARIRGCYRFCKSWCLCGLFLGFENNIRLFMLDDVNQVCLSF